MIHLCVGVIVLMSSENVTKTQKQHVISPIYLFHCLKTENITSLIHISSFYLHFPSYLAIIITNNDTKTVPSYIKITLHLRHVNKTN